MQRTIFGLFGIGDSGKTTTISLVYNHFRQEGATVIYGGDYARRRQKGATEIKGAVLEIDGVLVGFASPGDRPDILLPLLEALIERGCIIIVCASAMPDQGNVFDRHGSTRRSSTNWFACEACFK